MDNPFITLYQQNPVFAEFAQSLELKIPSNTILIKMNGSIEYIYIIIEGQVRIDCPSSDTEIAPAIIILGAGDIFGEMSLFSNNKASAQVTTISEVKVIRFHKAKVEIYLDQHPTIGYECLKYMVNIFSNRIRDANTKIGDLFSWGLDLSESQDSRD